ncbi:MAG: polyhydroxyalkanoate synthesis regulator DNA-binding domain-containing protein [Candidatus Riflebacteria bacterium]|nr:polyhydroxyalkanoate synthesis regulator DNA-binding domain-containing protein [Candidatus Riflebacteria bacterium]
MVMNPFGTGGSETVLRKYPNRRLYDPTRNTHVTLSEIADRVKDGERIRIVDHQSGEDLTHAIMGQVLFETLKTRPDYLPLDLILLMIRARDNLIRDFLQHGLPQAFQMYVENQRRMMVGMGWGAQNSFPAMQSLGGFFQNPFQSGGQVQNPGPSEFSSSTQPSAGHFAGGPSSGTDSSRLQEEMERMRREIDELKKQAKPRAVTGKKRKTPEV